MSTAPQALRPKSWIDHHQQYADYQRRWHTMGDALYHAPQALVDDVMNGKATAEKIEKNTKQIAKSAKQKNTVKQAMAVMQQHTSPLRFNPNVHISKTGSLMDIALRSTTSLGLVPMLLDAGFDPTLVEDETFIRKAVKEAGLKQMELLRNAGANLHAEDNGNALYAALNTHNNGHAKLKWLLEHGVNPYKAGWSQSGMAANGMLTPFEYELTHKNRPTGHITLLLDQGAGQIIKGEEGHADKYMFSFLNNTDTRPAPKKFHKIIDPYMNGVENRNRKFIDGTRPVSQVTQRDLMRSYAINDMRLFDLQLWAGHELYACELARAMPEHIQTIMSQHGVNDTLATTHYANHVIKGPAKDWRAMETSAPESGVQR